MTIITFIPLFLQYLGIDRVQIQLITTIFPFSSSLFPSFIGKFSDKVQNRGYFFKIGLIGATFTVFLLNLTRDVIFIALLILLLSFFNSCYRMIMPLFQELVENRSRQIIYYNMTMVLGWYVGSQLGGLVVEVNGINHFLLFVLMLYFLNIFLALFIKEENKKILQIDVQKEMEDLKNEKSDDNLEVKTPISKSIYIALFFRNFGTRPILSILSILMAIHLTNDLEIGFLIGFNPLIQFFLMLLTRNMMKDKNLKLFIIMGYILSAATITGYIFSNNFVAFLIDQVLLSCSFTFFWNATQIYIAKRTTPQNKGKYIGLANSSFFTGSFLGGIFFSIILIFNSNYYEILWIMIIFPLISAFSILLKFK